MAKPRKQARDRETSRRTVEFGDLVERLARAFEEEGMVSFSEGVRAACRQWLEGRTAAG